MTAQHIPDDIRKFILKYIASIPDIEALLLVWSNPDERWVAPQIAACIYSSNTETAKTLGALCAHGLLACENGVYSLNASADVEMIRRVQEVYVHYLIPVTEIIHGKARSVWKHPYSNDSRVRRSCSFFVSAS